MLKKEKTPLSPLFHSATITFPSSSPHVSENLHRMHQEWRIIEKKTKEPKKGWAFLVAVLQKYRGDHIW